MKMNELLNAIRIQASRVIFERYKDNLDLVINSNSFMEALAHSEVVTIETVEEQITGTLAHDIKIAKMCHNYTYFMGDENITNYNFIVDCGITSALVINIKNNSKSTVIKLKHLVEVN